MSGVSALMHLPDVPWRCVVDSYTEIPESRGEPHPQIWIRIRQNAI